MTQTDATHDSEGTGTDSYEPQFSTTIRYDLFDVDSLDERARFTRMESGLDRAVSLADQGSYRMAAEELKSQKRKLDLLADSLLAEAHHDE